MPEQHLDGLEVSSGAEHACRTRMPVVVEAVVNEPGSLPRPSEFRAQPGLRDRPSLAIDAASARPFHKVGEYVLRMVTDESLQDHREGFGQRYLPCPAALAVEPD